MPHSLSYKIFLNNVTYRLSNVNALLLFYSTELMRRVRRFQLAQYKCLVIKYAKDTRYSDTGMATHDRYVLTNRV